MRGGFGAALVVLSACALVQAQGSWDLTKCQLSAPAGHLCTPEHLETDLALLTAREIARFLDPEHRALELEIRRNPLALIRNPEASVPDPRTDPTFIQLLHAWAERGLIESEIRQTSADAPGSTLKGIRRVSLSVEDTGSSDDRCKSADAIVRVAAVRPIMDKRIKIVSDPASPAFYISVTAASVGTDGCAAFLSITLRNAAYVPGYQRIPRSGSHAILQDQSFITSPWPEFSERVTDQVRRRIDGFATQIALAGRSSR